MSNWITEEDVEMLDYEDLWEKYFQEPECEVVNDELKLFIEPSVQGGMGSLFIYDESGENRFSEVEVDYQEMCDKEIEMALDSESSDDFKEKYRNYMKELCNI